MADQKQLEIEKLIGSNPFVRVVGRDAPAGQVLAALATNAPPYLQIRAVLDSTPDDYTQIDPMLQADTETADATLIPTPATGIGYAGFTPQQRFQFLQWVTAPEEPAPPPYQQLYLAHLEARLFEGKKPARLAAGELQRLCHFSTWRRQNTLQRALLLSYWLAQDGPNLADWIGNDETPAEWLGLAVAWLAWLRQPLTSELLLPLLHGWQVETTIPEPAALMLWVSSLNETLGTEPLAHLLAQFDASLLEPRPWRCVHRDLRIAIPQPDARPLLEPLLKELAIAFSRQTPAVENVVVTPDEYQPTKPNDRSNWRLVLEFGESRSDFFQFALTAAQRLPGYMQLMDEDRKLVHRIVFKKSELRKFWPLWDYVQSWGSAKVFLNGEEVRKAEVYQYSPKFQ